MRAPFVFRGSAGFDAWDSARLGEGSAGHGEGKKAFYSVSSAFQKWQFVLFERVSSSKKYHLPGVMRYQLYLYPNI